MINDVRGKTLYERIAERQGLARQWDTITEAHMHEHVCAANPSTTATTTQK